MDQKLKVGITQGDINGVSYEVILKVLEDNRMLELCTPIVYGSAKIAAAYRKMLQMPNVVFTQIRSAAEARPDANNIINVVGEDVRPEPGVSTADAGKAAFIALEQAVADLKQGEIDVLVTAPINKKNIQSDTFHFPGHTEYLEAAAGEPQSRALMIMCCDQLRVALQTTHLPIKDVPEAITVDAIVEKLKVFDHALRADFRVQNPRIAVLALNPHAGDGGLLGSEEQEIIIPAIAKAQEEKVLAFGPYAADGFFGSSRFKHFDGVLAMYHDQGLAPFKALSMDRGVNFTAGLNFVRTSPDHGTGYDIAGKGEASPDSLREAIYTAIDIARNRRDYMEAFRHPLRKQYYEKGSDNVVLDLTGE